MATFGDIRALLHEPFYLDQWTELTRLIDAFDGSEDLAEVVIPYCLKIIERGWPPTFRRIAPKEWRPRVFWDRPMPEFSLITEVWVPWSTLRRDHCEVLVGRAPCEQLRALDLAHCSIEQAGLQLITTCDRWPRLETLNLTKCGIGARGAGALSQAPFLSSLTHLHLDENRLSVNTIEAVLTAENLGELEHLSLAGNLLSGGLDAIARSKRFHRLKVLKLGRNRLTNMFVDNLASASHLTNLEHLDLSHSPIDDRAAEAIAASPFLGGLTHLDLTNTDVGLEGVRALGQSPNVSNLLFFGFEPRQGESRADYADAILSSRFSNAIRDRWWSF